MIKVIIMQNEHDEIIGYELEGHANYADKGEDIVCSGVSVLAQTALMSLVNVIKIEDDYIDYSIKSDKGYLKVEIKKDLKIDKLEKSQIILESMVLGIKAIIQSYPGHVTLEYREV